ncbi:MAG: heme A synthase [Acidobacteria bacterium]|nr:heme A synthase [Acidobacteriota bacterium]
MRLSPTTYRRVTFWVLASLAVIVVTGAAVRLSGSGLGCTDWPNCERGRLAPAEISDAPAMIEFTNRMVTGIVSAAVIVAVLGARRRRPRRPDLELLAWGLVVGVVAQILLGGLVVLFDLSPRLVMGHFALSMLIVWDAVVLHHRAGLPDPGELGAQTGPPGPSVHPVRAGGGLLRPLARLVVAAAGIVVFTGTVVTAAGPHAGDSQAARLDLAIHDVARIHGLAVVVLVGLTLAFRKVAADEAAPPAVRTAGRVLFIVLLAQAAVGYTQYFTGVPALLVGVHICGALAVWIAATRLPLVVAAPVSSGELVAAT